MRIVVFSDSHNHFFVLKNIVHAQRGADLFLHLGDGERDFEALTKIYPGRRMYNVRGNCDWASLTPPQGILQCAGRRIFYTHGHTFHVKQGLDELMDYARGISADIALYGHTHQGVTFYRDGLYVMNPGSVSLPADGRPSYGIIDITDAGVAMNLVPL